MYVQFVVIENVPACQCTISFAGSVVALQNSNLNL